MPQPLLHDPQSCQLFSKPVRPTRPTSSRGSAPCSCSRRPDEAEHRQAAQALRKDHTARLQGCVHAAVSALQAPAQATARLAAAAALCLSLAACSPAVALEPFLESTGARGPLADEEARLFRLREEAEAEVRQELQRARQQLEEQGRLTQNGKLCATPFGVDVVGITELIALTGALVGGVTAKQRKDELEELNGRLRKINLSLRQQARVSTMYAPGLTYAPRDAQSPVEGPDEQRLAASNYNWPPAAAPAQPSSSSSASATATATAASPVTSSVMMTYDEEDMSIEARQCVAALREGKRLLKEKSGSSAMVRFEKALMLAKSSGERIYERRSMRGLAAAARLQGQLTAALGHLRRVLEISEEIGDHVGDADAHGTIADIYTDLGQFDKAAKCYDRYLQMMNADGPV